MNAKGLWQFGSGKQLREREQQRRQERQRLIEGRKQTKKPRKNRKSGWFNRETWERAPQVMGPPSGALPGTVAELKLSDGSVAWGLDPLKSIEQYSRSIWQGYWTSPNGSYTQMSLILPCPEPSQADTLKEETIMSINGLRKALARLEEPLYDVSEHNAYAPNVGDLRAIMLAWSKYYTGDLVVAKPSHGGSPIIRNRQPAGVSDAALILESKSGAPVTRMAMERVMSTAVNKEFITDMYPRAYGAAARVPVFFCSITDAGSHFEAVTEVAIYGMLRSQCFFDMPIAQVFDPNHSLITGYARFRAQEDSETNTVKLIALCRPYFLDPTPPSAPIRVVDTITLNIGEFPLDYIPTLGVLIEGYMAALDGVIDLGIGFDYDCDQCNVSYSALDPGSSDRALLAALGKCRTCIESKAPNFPDSVPAPF